MARPTGLGGARSVVRAAERLDEINREVAEILRAFPDLRSFADRRPSRAIFWTARRRASAGRAVRMLLH